MSEYLDVIGFRWDVLDRARRKVGELGQGMGRAYGGQLEWNVYADRSTVGRVTVEPHPGNPEHWHGVLLRPVALLAGGGEHVIATLLAEAPTRTYSHSAPGIPLVLKDLTARIEGFQDGSDRTIFEGDDLMRLVRVFIGWADPNDPQVAIPEGPIPVPHYKLWQQDDNMLTSVNEMLAMAGCYGLDVSELGAYRSNPYYRPHERPIWHRFAPGLRARHLAEVEETTSAYDAHNRVVVIGKEPEGGGVAPWVTADNTDDRDPASIPGRGYVRARVERLDSDDVAVMQAHANALLEEERRHTRTFRIQHLPLYLPMQAACEAQTTTGVDMTGTVVRKSWTLAPGELMTTDLREVPHAAAA